MRSLGINPTEYVLDLHIENHKTLMKDIKKRSKYTERGSVLMGWKTQHC